MIARACAMALLVAIACGLATPAASAPGDRKSVQLRGRITDERGAPIGDAIVTATGTAVLSTVANADGRYSLNLELGTVADLKKHPATWRIEAHLKNKKIPVAGGAEHVEFTVRATPEGVVGASSTLPALGTQLDHDLSRDGTLSATIPLDFSRARPGETPKPDPSKTAAIGIAPAAAASAPPAAGGAAAAGAAAGAVGVATATPRKTKGPATATELLEGTRQHGSMEAADAAADSVRAAERAARKEAERRRTQQEAAARDSAQRFARAQRAYAALLRDSLKLAERTRFQREQTLRLDSLRSVQRLRDSLEAVNEARMAASRDSQRAAQKAASGQREVLRMEQLQQMLFKRDSSMTALRARDSVNAANRARAHTADSTRAAARRDSLRALHPPVPLDRRPVVGGRPVESSGSVAVVESDAGKSAKPESESAPPPPPPCECRVRGTVEVRSEKPLASPLSVQIAVRGSSAKPVTVQLFMGSPRGFVFTHMPCGPMKLELTIPAGRRFELVDAASLETARCDAGSQWQPRLVLKPN